MATQQHSNYIAGEWVTGASTSRDVNPSDLSDVVGEYAQADQKQTEHAIGAARAAAPAWAAFNVQQRADVLDRIGTEILARKDELGTLLSREEGKTLPEGTGEVARAGNIFKFFAGEVLRRTGELVPSVRPGIDVEITREPVGVVGIISPWNFPAAIPAWKVAPALAYGNCVVFKPADLVPGSAWAMAEIISRAGLPAGVFNLVMGRGSVVGETMIGDPRVDAISFTGSVDTGRKVAQKAVAQLKKLQLEMGGKNPLVVLDDADLKTAVESAVNGAYFSTGQRCTASSRLIVTKGIHAKLVHGGNLLKREKEGFYLEPALFTETRNDMRINREEVFGPVAAVIAAKDYDEALAIANDTQFGLASGIVTTSLKHAAHFRRNSQAGMVMVNLPTAGVDYHVPFGGRKGSSYGPREQGRYAAEFYTAVKTSYVAAG